MFRQRRQDVRQWQCHIRNHPHYYYLRKYLCDANNGLGKKAKRQSPFVVYIHATDANVWHKNEPGKNVGKCLSIRSRQLSVAMAKAALILPSWAMKIWLIPGVILCAKIAAQIMAKAVRCPPLMGAKIIEREVSKMAKHPIIYNSASWIHT